MVMEAFLSRRTLPNTQSNTAEHAMPEVHDLPPSAVKIWNVLKEMARREHPVRCSVRTLARQAGVSVSTAASARKLLAGAGLIRIESGNSRYREPDRIWLLPVDVPASPENASTDDADSPRQKCEGPDISRVGSNTNGREWLARLFADLDPSMPPVSANALAASDFYANLAWALEFLHRTLRGREMSSAFTHQVLAAMCEEVSAQLDHQRLSLSAHERNRLEDVS